MATLGRDGPHGPPRLPFLRPLCRRTGRSRVAPLHELELPEMRSIPRPRSDHAGLGHHALPVLRRPLALAERWAVSVITARRFSSGMATYRESIAFETREGVQVLDLTDCVTSIIQRSGVRDGL